MELKNIEPINVIPDREFEPDNFVVNTLVLNNRGQYLLLKRLEDHTFYPGYWGVILEKLNEGESWEEGLFRGIREELNVEVDKDNILFSGEDIFKVWKEKKYQVKTYFIDIGEEEISLNLEHREYKWFDIYSDEINSLNIMPDALEMINRVRST